MLGAVLSFRSYTKYSPLQVKCSTVASLSTRYLLAVLSVGHRSIIAEEELSVEELNSHHGEDEKKENVDNENIKNVLEGDHDTVEDSFECRDSVDHLERTKHTKKFHGLELGPGGCAPAM